MKSTCPPPPAVHSYVDLVNFKRNHQDTIFVSVDIENIDHQPDERPFYLPMEKLSEMGVAVFDPRGSSSNSEVERIQAIQVQHTIIDEWAWVTSKTCPNRNKAWHRGAHKASPYSAAFCFSEVKSSQEVMGQITDYLSLLKMKNLTAEEVADGIRRKVVVLSWDANAESKLFYDFGYYSCDNDVEHWDFQLWLPVLNRFGHENKTGAESFYETTGVLGCSEDSSITLHNASNDAWAQLATLVRFFHMSDECFHRWVRAEEDLKPLDMSWVNLEILNHNAALEHQYKRFHNQNGPSGVSLVMRPAPHGKAMNKNGNQQPNPNPPPAVNDTAAFPGLPAPRTQTTKAPAKTVWGAKSNTQHLFKAKESRATGKSIGTERLNRRETKQPPATCWSRPLSFVPSTNTTSSSSSSPQSTTSSTPPSTVPSASTSRSPSPPTPTINRNAPASSSTATIPVNNGSNDFQSHHESASARNYGNGAADPAKEDGQCSSKKEPQKKRGRQKKKKQVVWEL